MHIYGNDAVAVHITYTYKVLYRIFLVLREEVCGALSQCHA